MTPQDDSDVKIYGKAGHSADTGDFIELASFLNRQRSNGNIAKAKALGERLAILKPESSSDVVSLFDRAENTVINAETMYQIRVLLIFVAQTSLHKKLASQLLSTCAVNAMYDKLIENSPVFYDGISDGAAFTFYSLSMHREKEISKSIGLHFAMLCGMEDDDKYSEFGANLFRHMSSFLENIIGEYRFEETV